MLAGDQYIAEDLPPNVVAVGNPARVIRTIEG